MVPACPAPSDLCVPVRGRLPRGGAVPTLLPSRSCARAPGARLGFTRFVPLT